MRTYVITTGVVFGLITVVHVWRFVVEGTGLARDPFWIGITVTTAALCVWAMRLSWRAGRP